MIEPGDANIHLVELGAEGYEDRESIKEGMNQCLDNIRSIRDDAEGIGFGFFLNEEPIIRRNAMNYIEIGNLIRRLGSIHQLNPAMDRAYRERIMIARTFMDPAFKDCGLWKDIVNDLDELRAGCEEVIRTISEQGRSDGTDDKT